jgi:hypothetical protein
MYRNSKVMHHVGKITPLVSGSDVAIKWALLPWLTVQFVVRESISAILGTFFFFWSFVVEDVNLSVEYSHLEDPKLPFKIAVFHSRLIRITITTTSFVLNI